MKLITKKNFSFHCKKPFYIFEIENFLDEKTFKKLKNSFPSEDNFPNNKTKDSKEIFGINNASYQIFLDKNLIWKNFLESFSNEKIVSELYKLTLKESVKNRGLSFLKKWTLNDLNFFTKFFYRKIFFTNYFALQKNGQLVYPHTDARTKLVSMIYYISGNEDGGTEFWKIEKNTDKWKNWNNKHLKEPGEIKDFKSDSKLVRKTKLIENKVVGFIKTDLSWHSVLDIGMIDKNKNRKTINFFYKY